MSNTSWIRTYTGKKINPLDPDPMSICIEDIAHALSNQCRFSGHVQRFYSVAEHSVRVSNIVQTHRGLMHDAAEAYLVDLPRPLKHHWLFGFFYRRIEKRVERIIMERFNLQVEQPESVSVADDILLMTEERDLMRGSSTWKLIKDVQPLKEPIVPWHPEYAEYMFLQQWINLR